MLVQLLFILVLLLLTHRIWIMPRVQSVLASLHGVHSSKGHTVVMNAGRNACEFTSDYFVQVLGKGMWQFGAMHSGQHNSLDIVVISSLCSPLRILATRMKHSNAIRDRPFGIVSHRNSLG